MRQFEPWALASLGAVVAVSAYLQALDFQFISDDKNYLIENHKLAGLHFAELWRLFTEPYNPYEFLPLRDLSYWFDLTLFGLTPAAFRIHNIILYLLCLPLVYAVTSGLWRYFRPAEVASAAWVAAVVTAMFALHPAHVEAVVWVSGRKDVLAGLFSLLALWFAMQTRQEQGFSYRYALATLIALLAALLSKATAVAVAPPIVLLWMLFWRDIPAQHRHRSQLLWPFASLILVAVFALIFTASSTIREPAYYDMEMIKRALTVMGDLFRLAVSLESRHFFYPGLDDMQLTFIIVLGAAVMLAAVSGAVLLLRRKSLEGFAIAAFAILCIPYLQLIPYRSPSLVVDRFVYLAAWPAILLMVALAWRLSVLPRMILLLVIALTWGYQTIERPRDWLNSETMIDTDLHAYPGYYMPAFQKVIWVQLPQGLHREARETASSIADPEIRSVVIGLVESDYAVHVDAVGTGNPVNAMVRLRNLETVLKQLPERSRGNSSVRYVWKYCRTVLARLWNDVAASFPDDESVRYNAGLWLLYVNKADEAAVHLRAAIESQHIPASMRGAALKNFGLALMNSGHIAAAESPLRAALEQSPPDLQAHCLLSEVFKLAGRAAESARAAANCPDRAINFSLPNGATAR